MKLRVARHTNNLKANDRALVQVQNPYWQDNGIMICDPDGYQIVISKQIKN